MIEDATRSVGLPFSFPVFVLETALDGTPPAYLTAELTPDSLGLFLFTGREFAERFATANGFAGRVRPAALSSAAEAAAAFGIAAENGIASVAIDAVADAPFLTFPVREFADRLAEM